MAGCCDGWDGELRTPCICDGCDGELLTVVDNWEEGWEGELRTLDNCEDGWEGELRTDDCNCDGCEGELRTDIWPAGWDGEALGGWNEGGGGGGWGFMEPEINFISVINYICKVF